MARTHLTLPPTPPAPELPEASPTTHLPVPPAPPAMPSVMAKKPGGAARDSVTCLLPATSHEPGVCSQLSPGLLSLGGQGVGVFEPLNFTEGGWAVAVTHPQPSLPSLSS